MTRAGEMVKALVLHVHPDVASRQRGGRWHVESRTSCFALGTGDTEEDAWIDSGLCMTRTNRAASPVVSRPYA